MDVGSRFVIAASPSPTTEPSGVAAAPWVASVIIPAYNAAATLGGCLTALIAQAGVTEAWEVIVVDDGSTDATAAVAASFPVRLVSQAHLGAAAARNHGATCARGTILLFTDADCRPDRYWVTAMLAPFADPDVAGVKGFFQSNQRRLVPRLVQAEYAEKEARMLGRSHVPFADTAAAAYRADVFRAAGGFRADLEAVEDTELSFRLAAAGQRIVVAPDAIVYHRHPRTVGQYARRKFRYGVWGARAYGAYPRRVMDDARTPWSMRVQLALAPLLILALVGAPFSRRARTLLGATLLTFVASALPFSLRAARRDPAVALIAPALFLVRALAVTAGLAVGFGAVVARRRGLH